MTETALPELPDGAERGDIHELTAFLNEIRTVWRAADQQQRDRMRRGVMVVLRGCRPGAEPFAAPRPLRVTDDGWFTERAGEFEFMNRDQLLDQARRWAWEYRVALMSHVRSEAGAKAMARDATTRLARVQGLLDARRPTVRTRDLQMALNPEMYAGRPGYPDAPEDGQ